MPTSIIIIAVLIIGAFYIGYVHGSRVTSDVIAKDIVNVISSSSLSVNEKKELMEAIRRCLREWHPEKTKEVQQ